MSPARTTGSERPGLDLPVWRLLDLGPCEPLRAQAFAESVAESVGAGESPNTLVVARPKSPYISLGFHQSFVEEIDPAFLERRRVPVLRRVEGGGTTWLDPDQWFYQLVYRDEGGGRGGAEDLARFLLAPARAAGVLGLTVELRPPSDLVVAGRKISGNAGGDWAGAHLLVGGFLGRADPDAMSNLLRLPHPALRSVLRTEVGRWVTSWEAEAGALPAWATLRDRLVDQFRDLGLFRARRGGPTRAEESRFRSETVPRHEDRSWRELPPIPRPRGTLLRRIRVAGPHGLMVFQLGACDRLSIAVIDGSEVRVAYRLDRSTPEPVGPLPAASSEVSELREAVRSASGFD